MGPFAIQIFYISDLFEQRKKKIETIREKFTKDENDEKKCDDKCFLDLNFQMNPENETRMKRN